MGAGEDFEYLDVHPSTEVGKNVRMLPPVSIAPGCGIGHLTTVGGRTSLGRGCTVGTGAVVEGSILLDGAEVEAGAVVQGSIVGPGARVGQNAIVRGLSVLGARSVIGEGNVLDQGIRVNPASSSHHVASTFSRRQSTAPETTTHRFCEPMRLQTADAKERRRRCSGVESWSATKSRRGPVAEDDSQEIKRCNYVWAREEVPTKTQGQSLQRLNS